MAGRKGGAMKTNAFAYRRADTVEDAVRIAREEGDEARFLAGGQSLLAAMNFRLDEPTALIDISRIEDLRGVSRGDGEIVIGALTRHADIEASPVIAEHLPLVAAAIREVAHPAIRNRGTFGGSLALADPAAELPACAVALDARIHIAGPGGARAVAADDFFRGLYETALEPGELVTHVTVPLPAPEARHGFAELARRHGDYAMTGLAMMRAPERTRVVYFALSERPVRARAAEAAIERGASPADCAAVADEGLDVLGDNSASEATKRHYARVLLRRALEAMASPETTS